MISPRTNLLTALALVVLGLASGAAGGALRRMDDLPGLALLGALVAAASFVFAVLIARGRPSARAVRAIVAAGVLVLLVEGVVLCRVLLPSPLHPDPQAIVSVSWPPSPRWTQAVAEARPIVRAAVSEQNLPGLSVAVGVDGAVVWAEGFGWADLKARRPITPALQFRMGTGSTLITATEARAPLQTVDVSDDDPRFRQRCAEPTDPASVAIARAAGQPFFTVMQRQVLGPLGMQSTGAESSIAENPEHVGEPEEDPPPFTAVHDGLLNPLGGWRRYGPDTIATVYVPRFGADPRRGVERMRPRNYACFGGAMAFYSTPSDLVRFGAAHPGGGDGELIGGRVMTLFAPAGRGLVVAVMANVTHAGTSDLARRLAALFHDTEKP